MAGQSRSDRCRYCGARILVAEGFSRTSERLHHEARCDLGVDCGFCPANAGERCKTASGKTTRHQSRRVL